MTGRARTALSAALLIIMLSSFPTGALAATLTAALTTTQATRQATRPAATLTATPATTAATAVTAATTVLSVSLTRVSAPSLKRDASVVVSGMIRNTGTTALTSLRAGLRLDWKLLDAAGLQEWAARGPGDPAGTEWDGSIETFPGTTLPPGASMPFSLIGKSKALALPVSLESFGPRGLAVEASGVAAGVRQTGLQRTFLVWDPGLAKSVTRLSILAPLTSSAPATDAGAPTADLVAQWGPTGRLTRIVEATKDAGISWAIDPALLSSTTRALTGTDPSTPSTGSSAPSASTASTASSAAASSVTASGAAAATRTSSASTAPTTPSQATPSQAAASQTTPSQAAKPQSPATPSAANQTPDTAASATAEAARVWLAAVRAGAKGRDLYALPWGDPDLAALAHADAGTLLATAQDEAASVTRDALGNPLDVTLALPDAGLADQQTLALLARASGRSVVLSDAVTGARPDGLVAGGRVALPGVRPDVTGLVSDRRLSATVQAMGDSSSALATQRLLADLAAASAASAGAAVTGTRGGAIAQSSAVKAAGRSVLATLSRDWNPQPAQLQSALALLRSAPWVKLETVAAARREAVEAGPRALAPLTPAARAAELPVAHVAAVATAMDALVRFAPALSAPARVVPALRARALSVIGVSWRQPAVGATVRDQGLASGRAPLVNGVQRLYSGVGVGTSGTVNLLGSSGGLPITVKNSLDQPVTLILSLRPLSARLRVTKEVTVTLQAAGDPQNPALYSARVPVDALANGDVPVEVRLSAPGGAVPLVVSPQPLQVRIRLDWEERGLLAAGVVLLGLLVLGLVRSVRRGRRRLPPESSPDPDDIGLLDTVPQPVLLPAHPAPVPEPVSEPAREPVLVPERGAAQSIAADTASTSAPTSEPASTPASTLASTLASTPAPASTSGSAPASTPASVSASGSAHDDLIRSSALMTAGTLVSRILGMVRVAVLSAAIGAKLSADAFNTANTLPNNLFILIGGGVLNAVLVPQIVRAARQRDGGKDFVDRLLTLAIVVLGGATVLVTLCAPFLIRIYSQSWDDQTLDLGTVFALWCLPQIFFYGLYTVFGQVLNARGSYGPYMWAPVVNNVVAIAGMLVFVAVYGSGVRPVGEWGAADTALLAGTTTLGVAAQALVLVPAMRRSGYTWRPRWGWRGVGLRTAGGVAAWTFAGVALAQAAFVVTSKIANAAGDALAATPGAPDGGRTVYDYAYLLFMLPHSLVAVSLVTAVFTRMSAAAQQHDTAAVRADLSLTVRTVGVATVLATVAFLVLGGDLAFGLFVHTPRTTTDRYALVAGAMLLGLVPFSAQYLFQRVCYAYEDAQTPFVVGALVSIVWTVGNVVAWWLLPAQWVVVGIGLAMSVASAVGAAVMVPLLRQRLGTVDGARIVRTHVRLLVAAIPAGGVGWLVRTALHAYLGDTRPATYLVLAGSGGILLLTYVLLLRVFRVGELDDLIAPLTARRR